MQKMHNQLLRSENGDWRLGIGDQKMEFGNGKCREIVTIVNFFVRLNWVCFDWVCFDWAKAQSY